MAYIQRADMADKKNNRFKYLVMVAVALTIITLLLAAAYIWKITPRPYSAVVLANGDIYFGKVSHFPKLSLSDPYSLQAVADPENPEQLIPQIVPMSLLVWAPENLVLNWDQVVSISKIGKDSQVMQLIDSRKATQ